MKLSKNHSIHSSVKLLVILVLPVGKLKHYFQQQFLNTLFHPGAAGIAFFIIAQGLFIAHEGMAQAPADGPCDSPPVLSASGTACSSTSYSLNWWSYASPNSGQRSACYGGSDFNGDDGWYRFVAASAVTVLELTGNSNHILAVYEGSCNSLSRIDCDQAASGATASLVMNTIVGSTYYVQIHRVGGGNWSTMSGEICIYSANIAAPGGVTASLELWLKANDGVFQNAAGTVPAAANSFTRYWKDNSPAARNAVEGGTNGTRARYVENASNFNPGISFVNDGDYHLKTLTNPATDDMSLFALYRTAQQEGGGDFWNSPQLLGAETNGVVNDYSLGLANGRGFFKAFSGNGLGAASGRNTSDNIPHILTGTRKKAAGARSYVYSDGIEQGSRPGDNASLTDPPGLAIGHSISMSDGRNKFNGQIPEVIIYSSELTAADRNKVETYLAVKYGITMGSVANTVNYTATDGTVIWTGDNRYQNDIGGIGRDDAQALQQKQSRSESPDAIFTFGNRSISATNATNTNSFTSDLSYFLWGNDNAPLDASGVTDVGMTVNGENIEARLNRTWKSQETGSVGLLKVEVDMSEIPGINGLGINDYMYVRLLVDQDGVFSSGATSVAPSDFDYVTGLVEFDFDFTSTSGHYFTLGSTDTDFAPLPVEFISVDASEISYGVLVEWSTATERDNEEFIVQRSQDGTAWTDVGTVPGAGTSFQTSSYQFPDSKVTGGGWYYRIVQVNTTGSSSYSNVVFVELEGRFRIYPNPVTDILNVEFPGGDSGELVEYLIQDFTGKVVAYGNLAPDKKNYIDMSLLIPGMYLIHINTDSDLYIEKIVKQ